MKNSFGEGFFRGFYLNYGLGRAMITLQLPVAFLSSSSFISTFVGIVGLSSMAGVEHLNTKPPRSVLAVKGTEIFSVATTLFSCVTVVVQVTSLAPSVSAPSTER